MKERIQLSTLFITVLLLFCASASAEEHDESLKNKHNPDQHHDVSDTAWHTAYYDPGMTNIYVTCKGVEPNAQNQYSIQCQSPAVWGACNPDSGGGLGPAIMCQCISYASEQHSMQYQIDNCK